MQSLLRSGLLVALLVLAGRLTGFGREWLIAMRVGASEATDLAIVFLTFPDLMVNLLLGGGLVAAMIPAFKCLGPGERTALFLQVTRIIGGGFLFLACAVSVFAIPVLKLLAPGMTEDVRVEYVNLFRVVTIALPLSALSGVVVALLNSSERFLLGAAGTLIFNFSVIACLIAFPANETVSSIAAGTVIGTSLRLLLQGTGLKTVWHAPTLSAGLIDRALVGNFIGGFGFFTVLSALPPVARAVSSLDDAGSLSLFNFAHKLVELPMGVVVGAISTVLLPRLAAEFSGSDQRNTTLAAGLRATLMLSTGIAIPAVVFSDTLVQIAFYGASFGAAQTETLAGLAAIGFFTLPFQALLSVYGTAFAANRNTSPLAITALFMLGFVLVASPHALEVFGLYGVMAIYGLAFAIGTFALTWLAIRRFGGCLLNDVLHNKTKALFVPVAIGLSVALVGDRLSSDLTVRMTWALISFLGFVLSMVFLDSSLRKSISSIAGGRTT